MEKKTKQLTEALLEFSAMEDELRSVWLQIVKADDGKLFPVDLVASAVVKRSLALLSGFVLLIREKNFICAAPLVRLHLDSLLRFSAIWLVKEPHGLATAVLGGATIRKIKDRQGNPMTDSYLVSLLSRESPWVKTVYEATSGYIHLSKAHIYNANQIDFQSKKGEIAVGKRDSFIPDSIRSEACDAMKAITEKILWFLHGWHQTKAGIHPKSPKRNRP
jgi:hypothetical protein